MAHLKPPRLITAALCAAIAMAIGADALGQNRGGGRNQPPSRPAPAETGESALPADALTAFSPQRATLDGMRSRGLVPTGLTARYPAAAKCPEVESYFASSSRSDGSRRAQIFFHGFHGGADIPVAEGTPVLAMADGAVVYKGVGGSIGGIGMILQHSPDDTGHPVWTYTEYKHLQRLPELELGRRVRKGETIALSGKTGTENTPAYGAAGFPHLHLSAYWSDSSDYLIVAVFVPMNGHWLDPLALFRGAPFHSVEIGALPKDQKSVAIAYASRGGATEPLQAKVIWPLVC